MAEKYNPSIQTIPLQPCMLWGKKHLQDRFYNGTTMIKIGPLRAAIMLSDTIGYLEPLIPRSLKVYYSRFEIPPICLCSYKNNALLILHS